jgi:hypothetical protein
MFLNIFREERNPIDVPFAIMVGSPRYKRGDSGFGPVFLRYFFLGSFKRKVEDATANFSGTFLRKMNAQGVNLLKNFACGALHEGKICFQG